MKEVLLAAGTACVMMSDPGVALAGGDVELDRNAATHCATLPNGVLYPESSTVNPATGDVFVAAFDFGPNANKLMRFMKNGKLAAVRDLGGGPMLGLDFDPAHGKVYVLNMAASKVRRIAANFDAGTAVEDVATVPSIGAPAPRTSPNPDGSNDLTTFGSNGLPAPNAMTFDRKSNLDFSDSFQGATFRIDNAKGCKTPCTANLVSHDTLLATAGFPPFGANGLALDSDETTLCIANTGDQRVLKMDLATKAVSVFAVSINGAHGLAFDDEGRLWVAANRADEIEAQNGSGRIIARLGEFQGIRNGTPDGLLFPASIANVGDWTYVNNLALSLSGLPGAEPEVDATHWTVSRLSIPKS
jgi:hypothetical protein